jgi:hypothetical protein
MVKRGFDEKKPAVSPSWSRASLLVPGRYTKVRVTFQISLVRRE